MTHIDINIDQELSRGFCSQNLNYSVLIDGESLEIALNHENSRKSLVCVVACAKSMIFCGLMPQDKVRIVRLLQENIEFKPLVAVIGSGEGDIHMLQQADLGIGIKLSTESLAMYYSDMVVKEIQYLESLILVKGYYNYTSLCKSIFLLFYTSFFLTIVLLVYTFLSSFSDTSIFNASQLIGYNFFFTSLPILLIGAFDENISRQDVNKTPWIYAEGINNTHFDLKSLRNYLVTALIHGFILVTLSFICLPRIVSSGGQTESITVLGSFPYIILVLVILGNIHVNAYCYSAFYAISVIISLALLIAYFSIPSTVRFPDSDLLGIGGFLINSPFALISIFFTPLACIIPTYFFMVYRNLFDRPAIIKQTDTWSIGDYLITKLKSYENSLGKIYKSPSSWTNLEEEGQFYMNSYTLRFKLSSIEKKFSEAFIKENLTVLKIMILLFWAILILWCTLEWILLPASEDLDLMRILFITCSSIIVPLLWTSNFRNNYRIYISIFLLVLLVSKFIVEVCVASTSLLLTALISVVTLLILNSCWFSMTLLNILNMVFFTISLSIEYSSKSTSSYAILAKVSSIILELAIALTSCIIAYSYELTSRTRQQLTVQASQEAERNQSISNLLLPPIVQKRRKAGLRPLSDTNPGVAVIFCEISDFPSICQNYTPYEIAIFLTQVFGKFDKCCEATGVTVMQTVGNIYIAYAGLKESEEEIPRKLKKFSCSYRAVECALAVLEEAKEIQMKDGGCLRVRIGITTEFFGIGEIGYHKPQVFFAGEAVNEAHRHTYFKSRDNTIHISSETLKDVKDCIGYEFSMDQCYSKAKNLGGSFINERTNKNTGFYELDGWPCQYNENLMSGIAIDSHAEGSQSSLSSTSSINSPKRLASDILEDDPTIDKCSPFLRLFWWRETQQEKDFRLETITKNNYSIFLSLWISLTTFTLLLVTTILQYLTTSLYQNPSILLIRIIVVTFLAFLVFLRTKFSKCDFYSRLLLICIALMDLVPMLNITYRSDMLTDFTGLEVTYIIILCHHCSEYPISPIFIINFLLLVPWIVLVVLSNRFSEYLINIILTAAFSLVNLRSIYMHQQNHRINYNLNSSIKKEIEESKGMIAQLMPAHALELITKQKLGDNRNKVTIIVVDILDPNFYELWPEFDRVLEAMSNLFTRFDKLCTELDVFKVNSFGCRYVAVGDTWMPNRDYSLECLNCMKVCFKMIDILHEENKRSLFEWVIRIGVHTGDIICGVIGTSFMRFDIWGTNVIISNQIADRSRIGGITVSEDTKELLQSRLRSGFKFEEGKEVTVASIEVRINTYDVECSDIDSIDFEIY